jgi:heat shock protein HslJ
VPPPTEDLARLRANSWQWVEVEGAGGPPQIKNAAAYRLTFNTDATLSIAVDCASVGGSYQGEAGKLVIELATDVPDCGPDSRAGELLAALPAAVRYTFEGKQLRMEIAGESSNSTLVFEPAASPAPVPTSAAGAPSGADG